MPGFEGFGIPARKVSMDGVDVWALEYPNVAAYENMRSRISDDGYEVGNAHIDWTSHIYGSGRLIVVYVGNRPATQRSLEQLFGQQFAGV